MESLFWIIVGGLLMSAIAMVGSVTMLMKPATLERIIMPIVALAAGTLLGGAFFHMIPEGAKSLTALTGAVWLVGGFTVFLALEQFIHWHHSHRASEQVHQPVTYLILLGDALHNFMGGLGISSTFLISPQAGAIAWLAAVAHEVPQELGDFGILVHGGWRRHRALLWNALSALTFPLGAVLAYLVSKHFEVSGLVLFGAGNFLYIAASDLIPEIKAQGSFRSAGLNFGSFTAGLLLMLACAYGIRHFGP